MPVTESKPLIVGAMLPSNPTILALDPIVAARSGTRGACDWLDQQSPPTFFNGWHGVIGTPAPFGYEPTDTAPRTADFSSPRNSGLLVLLA